MELMAEAMKQFASMENSEDLESENAKLKEEIASKTEEIIELRHGDPRTRNSESSYYIWMCRFKNATIRNYGPLIPDKK